MAAGAVRGRDLPLEGLWNLIWNREGHKRINWEWYPTSNGGVKWKVRLKYMYYGIIALLHDLNVQSVLIKNISALELRKKHINSALLVGL